MNGTSDTGGNPKYRTGRVDAMAQVIEVQKP